MRSSHTSQEDIKLNAEVNDGRKNLDNLVTSFAYGQPNYPNIDTF